jgi:hypothetical protein
MVDFNKDSMISKPPIEIINLIIVEHWYNFRLAYEYFVKHKINNASIGFADCRCRLTSLFLCVIELLKKRLPKEEYEMLYIKCLDLNINLTSREVLECYIIINRVLDEAGLIKVDTKPFINRSRIEESNQALGY